MGEDPPPPPLPPPPALSTGPSPLARAKSVYLSVRELESPERESELERLCAGDAALRRAVEALLAGERAPLPFETLAEEIVAARDAMAGRGEAEGAAGGSPEGGSRIGPYRVLEKIGEGGFGVVYMAEQEEPVRRRVALKILKLGMDSRQVVARFEAERQALAIMDHPVIARVFDAGATRSGRPYFVMELVRGEPITAYCDRRFLSIERRLELFGLVCEGVQHAHQKGIIHRDLKPANILVAEVDGRPSPKIIDFGIAKAISQRLTEKTYFTEFRQMIGTPAYMSPEQAEPGAGRSGEADIDTRADVYSLGVILYELLAGATPFDAERLRSAAYGEMQRIICEEDPPRPSTRLSGLATRPSVAAQRTIAPAQLGSLLEGELDWVVMKCLNKDRDRRYGSAADLAEDVARFLHDQPVVARPASRAYIARKFIQRHRRLVSFAAVVALLLTAGVTGTAWGLLSTLRAKRKLDAALEDVGRQRDAAQVNERRAATQLARSQQLTQFLRSMLKSAGPAISRDRDTTVLRELLEKALGRIDAGELAREPIVEAEMRAAIADTFKTMGDNTAALRVIEPAIRLADAAPVGDGPAFLGARQAAAGLLTEWRRDDEAMAQLDRIIAVRAEAAVPEDTALGEVYVNYATLLARRDRPEEALTMFERARGVNERIFGPMSPNVAATLGNIAGLLTGLGRHDEALASYQRLLTICASMDPPPLMHIAIVKNNAAGLLVQMKRFADAEAMARESLEVCERIFKADHQQTGMSWHTLGSAVAGLGRHEEAHAAYVKAATVLAAAFNDKHPFVTQCRVDQGRELAALGRRAEAEPLLIAAHETTRQTGDGDGRSACLRALFELYAAWEAAEPGQGYGDRAARWRLELTSDAGTAPSR